MSVTTLDGYNARIEYDPEIEMVRREILGLTGGADFYGKTPKEIRSEFKKSLKIFLEVCKENGIEPRRNYSGKFNLRVPPELHEKLVIAAQAEGKSINTLAQEALAQRVSPSDAAQETPAKQLMRNDVFKRLACRSPPRR